VSESRVSNASPVILPAKAGLIAEAKPHLLQIKKTGGYIGDELFRETLRRAGEQP
jgi:predicted nucleic acid-binding protein